jgi:two-component system chemotaxis response regulator CheB
LLATSVSFKKQPAIHYMANLHRDIIVVGASAGGIDAISQLVCGLPPDLDAAVLIVLHMAPTFPRVLAERLARMGSLPAADAVDGATICPNRIYLCVPDRHLLVAGDKIRLSRGPKENHSRPSVDALFRSAAYSCGARVIGVVLTGQLDDGTAGLWAIKDRGGLAIVQDPAEAAYRSMPESALRQNSVDYTLKVGDMGTVLRLLTREEVVVEGEPEPELEGTALQIETAIASGDSALDKGVRKLGKPSVYTCPDCHGTMFAINEGPRIRFRCHTGHAYSARALAEYTVPAVEKTLWMALAQLEEREILLRELGQQDERSLEQAKEVSQLRLRLHALLKDPALSQTECAVHEQPNILSALRGTR